MFTAQNPYTGRRLGYSGNEVPAHPDRHPTHGNSIPAWTEELPVHPDKPPVLPGELPTHGNSIPAWFEARSSLKQRKAELLINFQIGHCNNLQNYDKHQFCSSKFITKAEKN